MLRSAILAGLAVSLAATPAVAREWSYVTGNSLGVAIAVSPASFSQRGDLVSGLFRFRDRKGAYSYRHVRIDCRRGVIADAAAGPTDRVVPQDIAWRPVVARSLGAELVWTLCPDDAWRASIERVGPDLRMRVPLPPPTGTPRN